MASFDDKQLKSRENTVGDGNDSSLASRPTLREDARNRTRERIIEGAIAAVAASGLDATVDEIADAAGVSRRTVFRHFATQGELILATLIEVRRKLDEGMPGPPPPGADFETWLTESVVRAHELFRTLIGRFFWDLYTERHHISPEVTARISGAMALRQHYAKLFADAAWRAIGGEGEAPIWVRDSFAPAQLWLRDQRLSGVQRRGDRTALCTTVVAHPYHGPQRAAPRVGRGEVQGLGHDGPRAGVTT